MLGDICIMTISVISFSFYVLLYSMFMSFTQTTGYNGRKQKVIISEIKYCNNCEVNTGLPRSMPNVDQCR